MFIKSYEKLREYIINNKSIATLVQMEYSAYEEATVPICSFVLKNEQSNALGYYFRLSDFKGGMEVQKQKVLEALSNKECGYFYETSSSNFTKIPGSPIAYWLSNNFIGVYQNKPISNYGIARSGLQTGDNNLFLKLWHEININSIAFNTMDKKEYLLSQKKWIPQVKGGSYRRWFGNQDYVVNWENDGFEIRNCSSSRLNSLGNDELFCKSGITWSHTTSSKFGARFLPRGFLFNVEAPTLFTEEEYYLLGFLNSSVAQAYLNAVNSTMHYLVGNIIELPLINFKNNQIDFISKENISISKLDWDSYETSWDFIVHPLVKNDVATIHEAYSLWKTECSDRFHQLKANEEKLNKIFIDIYGLQNQLTPDVEDKDVTVHYVVDTKEDIPESMKGSNYIRIKQDEMKSFISYVVGCMFGRYSLDVEGLAYAGGAWDDSKYTTFVPDADDIIPICDEEYFEDDIVSRFVDFVSVVYGSDTLEENLKFIADALGGKGTPREVLRNYFLNDFFKDHCNTYQVTGSGKRPIYWLFDSGKKNGFKALVYIHRYTPDLIARMRTGYIHPQQARYRTQIELLQEQIDMAGSTSEKVKLSKQLKKINEQLLELNKYEEIVHHWADKMEPMDLDDGVKVNYAKFQELLAKIK